MVESSTHLSLKKAAAVELRNRGFEVWFEKGFALFDRDILVDVFGSNEGLCSFVECESSVSSYKILNRFTLLKSLEGNNRLILALPALLQDAIFPWVLRLRNIVDEVWLVDVDKVEVVNVVDPGAFRGGKMRGKVSVDYLGERYELQPWKVLRFLMNDRDLVLGIGDRDCDFKIVRLDVEKRDQMNSGEIVYVTTSGKVLYDFMDRIRDICLSKARMKIYSYLLINGISSPGKLHEAFGYSIVIGISRDKISGKRWVTRNSRSTKCGPWKAIDTSHCKVRRV